MLMFFRIKMIEENVKCSNNLCLLTLKHFKQKKQKQKNNYFCLFRCLFL